MDIQTYTPVYPKEDAIGKSIVEAACKVKQELGFGLLEDAYQQCFCHILSNYGYDVKRQLDIPIVYDNLVFNHALQLDVLVNDLVICEFKSFSKVTPVYEAQVLSKLKQAGNRVGYLISFDVHNIEQGVKRFVV